MGIHARGYRPYRGRYLPPGGAALKAIFWAALRRPWRSRGFRMLLVSAQFSAIIVCIALYVQVFIEGALSKEVPLDALATMSGPLRWLLDQNYLLYHFLLVQLWGAALLTALVAGSDAIAGDIRANAMPLYFSRPVTRTTYLAGKLLAIGVYLTLVTVIPALVVLVFKLALSHDAAAFWAGFTAVAPLVIGALVVDVTVALLVLGCSAAGGKAWAAGIAFAGVWLIPYWATEGVASLTGRYFIGYVSLPHLVRDVLASLFQQSHPLYLVGVAPALTAWLVGIVALLYWRLNRAAELR